ncbi:nitrate reductase molybdenum cofactor assembly chaperone [Mycobacterium riyadhense]|uniref:Nitrate reductase n=1 Tax=Mycobacterium riyadhense TaxID=486698 RepID=A0A1X2CY36_9MYCO|nr:nitrate reductase molybdenum cofactor assembly chaperone [Mycobacterium riyadhense]MCV7145333.1 nitrate reductase molybdenum cofactor assembly chaperone [Mycobacterium riyadhense]ORW80329.1 nitrate reductase [Mycobacterium riyadhense]VTP00600.1 Nitrate reductase-like protein NarX [Mycobacterium riyadhense]
MKLWARTRQNALRDRMIWQCAALLLSYPEPGLLDTAEGLLAGLDGDAADLLGHTAAALRASDPIQAAADYVATFDLQRCATMYLTYWTAGDTRQRGNAMLAFVRAYRNADVEPPHDEAPDFLPVVLEFAATVEPDSGRRLLIEHRVPIDVLRAALAQIASPYAHAVAAVRETLPAAADLDVQRARRLAQVGPPAEAVGLQPFTLTVPPRRTAGGR